MQSKLMQSLLRYGIAFLAALLIILAVVSVLSLYFGPPRPSYETGKRDVSSGGVDEVTVPPTPARQPALPESCAMLGLVSLTEEHPYRFTRVAGDEQVAVLDEIIAAIRGEGGEFYGPRLGGVEVAMEFDSGWLVGSRLGEAAGEVLVVNRSGIFDVLLAANDMPGMTVVDMHLTPAGYVIISAAKGPFDRAGLVFVLDDSGPDRFAVKRRHALVGTPASVWHVSGGNLLLKVDDQHFVLQSGGQLTRTSCSDPGDPAN